MAKGSMSRISPKSGHSLSGNEAYLGANVRFSMFWDIRYSLSKGKETMWM